MNLTENQLAIVVRALKAWPALARKPRISRASGRHRRTGSGLRRGERHVYVTDAQSEISRRQLRRPGSCPGASRRRRYSRHTASTVALLRVTAAVRRDRLALVNAMERRRFFSFFAATGLTSTLLPGALWAQIQPGTRKLTIEMVREAARLAGLTLDRPGMPGAARFAVEFLPPR